MNILYFTAIIIRYKIQNISKSIYFRLNLNIFVCRITRGIDLCETRYAKMQINELCYRNRFYLS